VIALMDIDGVVCDLVPSVLTYLNDRHGLNVALNDIKEWNPSLGKDREIQFSDEVNEFFKERGRVSKLPIVNGSADGVRAILNSGVKTVFITGRSPRHQTMTRWWLQENFGLADPLLIHAPFGKQHWRQVFPDAVLIDDSLFEISKWEAVGGTCIVFDQPWNREVEVEWYQGRVKEWSELVKIIKEWR